MVQKALKPLNISIDPASPLPVYEQVKQGIKILIFAGHLQEGDQLVPIRELANQLKINPNTIVKVYYQLDQEGLIYPQHGSGYFVRPGFRPTFKNKRDLLLKITEEYLYKGLQLGFAVDELTAAVRQSWTTAKPSVGREGVKR